MIDIRNALILNALILAATLACLAPAHAQPLRGGAQVPFSETLSNNAPLAFGMDADDTARALNTPLATITGRPGNEVLLAIRTSGGSGFFDRRDRLYLQFRHGRLTGWKGDWGHRWIR